MLIYFCACMTVRLHCPFTNLVTYRVPVDLNTGGLDAHAVQGRLSGPNAHCFHRRHDVCSMDDVVAQREIPQVDVDLPLGRFRTVRYDYQRGVKGHSHLEPECRFGALFDGCSLKYRGNHMTHIQPLYMNTCFITLYTL